MSLGAFVTVLEFVGLYVFATSGALMAIHKGFDIVGIAILALLTALGGGIIRDLTIGDTPRCRPRCSAWSPRSAGEFGGGVLRDITARETPALVRTPTEIYAIRAATGAAAVVGADRASLNIPLVAASAAVGVFALRIVAMLRHWTAPGAINW